MGNKHTSEATPEASKAPPFTRPVPAGSSLDRDVRPASVLIVEDEQIVALELEDRLRRRGYEVVGLVASGEEAVEAAARFRPDLILMDIKLQGAMDGVDAAGAIRKDQDAAIVYVTAFADDSTVDRAKTTEPYGYIVKPIQARELHAVVEVALYRQRMERQLRESEAWRAALLRCVGTAVVATGTDSRIRFMNSIAESMTGWDASAAIGRELWTVLRLISSEEQRPPPWQGGLNRKLVGRHGSVRQVEVSQMPIIDDRGDNLGTVWSVQDVSARKQQEGRQRLLTAISTELASAIDPESVFPRIAELIARQLAAVCAIEVADEGGEGRLAAIAPHSLAEATATTATTPTTGDRVDALVARPGRAVPTSVDLVVRGQIVGRLVVAAERPFDAEELVLLGEIGRRLAVSIDNGRLYRKSVQSTRMREELLAIVSHDLRNPLSAILLSVGQLRRAPEQASSERIAKQAGLIERNAETMQRLIADLLSIETIDSGHLSLSRHPVLARDLLEETVQRFASQAMSRGLELRSAGCPDARALVDCDRERVLQVLSNLVGNALKFSASGKTVTLGGQVTGDVVEFFVKDEAGGIPAEQLEHLWDKYWTSDVCRGIGLGLYIAKKIVEGHGGQIWVDSVPGVGSGFRFTLPRAAAAN